MKATDRSAAKTAARLGAIGSSVALVVMGSVAPAWASSHARTPESSTTSSAFPTGPVTLTLATEDTSKLTPALIAGFEKLHPNVKIVQQTTSYTDYLPKINLELASSTPPTCPRSSPSRPPSRTICCSTSTPTRPSTAGRNRSRPTPSTSTGWARTSSPATARSTRCPQDLT